jgi:hypothetical protein
MIDYETGVVYETCLGACNYVQETKWDIAIGIYKKGTKMEQVR